MASSAPVLSYVQPAIAPGSPRALPMKLIQYGNANAPAQRRGPFVGPGALPGSSMAMPVFVVKADLKPVRWLKGHVVRAYPPPFPD